MNTLKMPSALPEIGVRASRSSPIVIATDGRNQSDAALVVGRQLAGSADAMRVVSAVTTMPTIPETHFPVTIDIDAVRRAETRKDVAMQMNRAWDTEYDLELLVGDPATAVASVAHQTGATMIVAGLGRHRVSDRVFGDETALRLIRVADVPVLAVASSLNNAPRRIVVAADFCETSLRAARLALEIAAANATVYLAHVAPRDSALRDWREWGNTYKQDAGDALQKTLEQLRVPKGTTVQKVLLQGDPATELLAFAASVNADLIATGTHGHGFIARLLVGSVTTRVVRCSTCSVLTVPHIAAMTSVRTTVEPSTVTVCARSEWASQLDAFSLRNSGRAGMLEVDDPELGAQALVSTYPLVSVAFDAGEGRVDMVFGDPKPRGPRVSRGIGSVAKIELLKNEAGRDVAMRIRHGNGQTLLTFSPQTKA